MKHITSEVMEETGGTLLTLYEDDVMVACLEYYWIATYADLNRIGRGERPQGGNVLYVTNIATSRPGSNDLQMLKASLPPHRYIAGLRLTTPKGVPHDFYVASTAVAV